MKGDFSRDTFGAIKRYRRVLMQQGRVQLDADSNEQVSILLHYIETLASDLIGPCGGPEFIYDQDGTESPNLGFEVSDDFTVGDSGHVDFNIGNGRYYVDGILCENYNDSLTYQDQDDYPGPDLNDPLVSDTVTEYLVYLDVWERLITSLEDDGIREKALNEADTAARAKTVWQVKLEEVDDGFDLESDWNSLLEDWQPPNRGALIVGVDATDVNEPCISPHDANYKGVENQIYRVEIHEGGVAGTAGTASFKWSRNNASTVTGCEWISDTELKVDNPGGFEANQWVELTSDEQELRGDHGEFMEIKAVDGGSFTFENIGAPTKPKPDNEDWPTKIRRWDGNGETKITEGVGDADGFQLESGIKIQFKPVEGAVPHTYRTGDYWLIPARQATGIVEWPMGSDSKPKSLPPHGVEHHYAPLGVITYGNGSWTVNTAQYRKIFGRLTE